MDRRKKNTMGQAENVGLFKEMRKECSYIHLDDPGATEASISHCGQQTHHSPSPTYALEVQCEIHFIQCVVAIYVLFNKATKSRIYIYLSMPNNRPP